MIQQILAIIRKDLKLLTRSKSSTLAVLVGPLVVVLLVGLAFTNAGGSELTIGIVESEFENQEIYADALKSAFSTVSYTDSSGCERDVKKGLIVSCVAFRSGDPPKADIYVDPSDNNVVYAVIDHITGKIEDETNTVRTGLTTNLLDSTTKTLVKLNADADQLRNAQSILTSNVPEIATIRSDIDRTKVDVTLVKRWEVQKAIDLALVARNDFRTEAYEILEDYRSYIRRNVPEGEDATSYLEDTNRFEEDLVSIEDSYDGSGDAVFNSILTSLDSVEQAVSSSQETADGLTTKASQVHEALLLAKSDVDTVVRSIDQTKGSLGSLNITRTDITTPIEVTVEPVVSDEDRFSFAFPIFIVLIIMFTAILLGSTIIVRERHSRAYFRNFATPVPESIFVLSTYITTLAVLAVQIIIIYLLASLLSPDALIKSGFATVLSLFAITTFFTLLGMFIGYVFKTQEGVMLSSITIASVFLMVSNVILPVKTLPGAIRFLVKGNPFVIANELLRATTIFGFTLKDIGALFFILAMYCVMMFALIMIVQRIARIRFFEVAGSAEHISKFLGEQKLPQERALILGDIVVRTKDELLKALRNMSDQTYERYATHKNNLIADWIADVYKDEKLEQDLRNKSRNGAVETLQRYLNK